MVGNPKSRPGLSLLDRFPAHLVSNLTFQVPGQQAQQARCLIQHFATSLPKFPVTKKLKLTSLLVLSTPLAASKAASSSPPLPSSTGCRPACSQHQTFYHFATSNMRPCFSNTQRIKPLQSLMKDRVLICVSFQSSFKFKRKNLLQRKPRQGQISPQLSHLTQERVGRPADSKRTRRENKKYLVKFSSNLSSVLRENLHHPPLHLEMRS